MLRMTISKIRRGTVSREHTVGFPSERKKREQGKTQPKEEKEGEVSRDT